MIIAFEKSWKQDDERKFIKQLRKKAKKQDLDFKSIHIGLSDSDHPGSTSGMDGGHDMRHVLWSNEIERLKRPEPKDELKKKIEKNEVRRYRILFTYR